MANAGIDWNSLSVQLNGTYLERQIRRANRNLLLVAAFLILGVVVYGIASWRYFYNFFTGPYGAGAARLSAIKSPDDELRFFLRVKGEQTYDSGFQEIERETEGGTVKSETVKAKYSILLVEGRFLIVKGDPNYSGVSFQGGIEPLPQDLRADIITPLLQKHPDANERFFPLMLDATGFRNDGYLGIAICIPTVLLGLWLIRKVLLRKNNPAIHPVVKSASRYGSLVDTAQQLDSELRGDTVKFGKASVTPSWVLLPTTFGLSMCRIPDLIWTYKKVTRHYHTFIPTGKTYALIMYDRFGVPLTLQARLKKVDALLALLAQRSPWAIFGYSDELKKHLQTNWRGFIATVDARRAGPPPQPASG